MFGGVSYAGGAIAGGGTAVADIPVETEPRNFAVEVSFTTDALAEPVWVDISADCRSWDVGRGRTKELERFQPGRATIVLDNSDRAYDSQHATGPWFGNLRPMRRIRIRETFNGVTYPRFDGFVDRWSLDYPEYGVDATATITATDGMKVFARSDLPRSVYFDVVEADAPRVWWRLDEDQGKLQDGFALNSGTGGSTDNGTFVGNPTVGAQGLVVNDPGSALQTRSSDSAAGTPIQGVRLANATLNLLAASVFSVEAWFRLDEGAATIGYIANVSRPADVESHMALNYQLDSIAVPSAGRIEFVVLNSAFSLFYGVKTANGSVLPGQIHHVVAVVEASGQMVIYLDGVRNTALATGATATSLSGITRPTTGDFHVAHENRSVPRPNFNWHGTIDEAAVYLSDVGATVAAAHNTAGRTPWQGDLPGVRAGRVADEADWPTFLREIDAGVTTFQSASLFGQTVLEHLHKVAESEAGIFFMTRAGVARLVARAALAARVSQATFGDDPPHQFVDLPGTSGNYISTPDSAAVSVTGDIDIRVKVAMDDWTPGAFQSFVSKRGASAEAFEFRMNNTNVMGFNWWTGAAARSVGATAATGFVDGTTNWVRITRATASGDVKFFTSNNGVSWNQLGATVTSTTGLIDDTSATLVVGAGEQTGTTRNLPGNVFYAEVRNGIDGPVVAAFDGDRPNVQEGTRAPSTVSSATGETWTINGSAWTWGIDPPHEIGYRRAVFDDGFDSVRNRVTISRLNGVAKQATSAASVAEFGHMDYVLDGLLHDTDAHSLAYANFIRDNYPDPVRRVVALELGPAAPGAEAALYPQMLGRELGDMITVKHRPPGGGDVWEQDVVIEGTTDRWDPHSMRTCTWTLAPAPGGVF